MVVARMRNETQDSIREAATWSQDDIKGKQIGSLILSDQEDIFPLSLSSMLIALQKPSLLRIITHVWAEILLT